MQIEDWPSAKARPALYRELKALGLIENLAELEAFGFTVIPPAQVGDADYHRQVQDAAYRVACDRKDCADADELAASFKEGQELLRFVLWDDPVFERLVLNPAALGLVQWLVGTDCVLSLANIWVKGQGKSRTAVHADWAQFDMPTMAVETYGANFNYLVTDYSREEGGLCFVPGSHLWRRWPSAEESEYWSEHAHPVEAEAGSMIIWGDHTWHGSYSKATPGLRMMVLGMYNRPHMQTQEAYRETAINEALARNPARFTRLMNVYNAMPWGKSPGAPRAGAPQGYLSLFDTTPVGETVSVRPPTDFHTYDKAVGEAMKAGMSADTLRFPDMYKGNG